VNLFQPKLRSEKFHNNNKVIIIIIIIIIYVAVHAMQAKREM
jgi:hypothetical protein